MVVKISVFLAFSLLQTLYFSNCFGTRISQEKCDYYQKIFSPGNLEKEFPYMAIVYNGDHLSDGVLISENFVLTYANNGTARPFVIPEFSQQKKFEVVEEIRNQNIRLLKLNDSVKFNKNIRPACLPRSQYSNSKELTEICLADDFDHIKYLKLKIISNTSCDTKPDFYGKTIRIDGAAETTNICVEVQTDSKNACKNSDVTLLADHLEVVGIASNFLQGSPRIFYRISEYVSWIEGIVWPSENRSTTTEQSSPALPSENTTTTEKTPTSPSGNGTTTTEKTPTSPSGNGTTTTEKTASSAELLIVTQIGAELHEIHKFLNVNLVLIVLVLLFVLCISCILWSDGLCIRAVLPDHHGSKSTEV